VNFYTNKTIVFFKFAHHNIFFFIHRTLDAMRHPDMDFMEDEISFGVVMLKRELMADVREVWRMREMERRYERYERYMRGWYRHEDDWPPFDMDYDYAP